MKYIGLARGGNEGAIAILEIDGMQKYYDLLGVAALLQQAADKSDKNELQQALLSLKNIDDSTEIPEFEGGFPQQGTLF